MGSRNESGWRNDVGVETHGLPEPPSRQTVGLIFVACGGAPGTFTSPDSWTRGQAYGAFLSRDHRDARHSGAGRSRPARHAWVRTTNDNHRNVACGMAVRIQSRAASWATAGTVTSTILARFQQPGQRLASRAPVLTRFPRAGAASTEPRPIGPISSSRTGHPMGTWPRSSVRPGGPGSCRSEHDQHRFDHHLHQVRAIQHSEP